MTVMGRLIVALAFVIGAIIAVLAILAGNLIAAILGAVLIGCSIGAYVDTIGD